MSTASQPTTASMHTRACLSSASRSHVKASGPFFEKPSGSKPTSPASEPSRAVGASRKGNAFDLADIATPLLRPLLGARSAPVGAKASAETVTMAIIAHASRLVTIAT